MPIKQPSPPQHPRPIQRINNAWNTDLEPNIRAPSRCDQREESSDEQKTSEEDDLESTFTIQKDANKISRASTPDVPTQMKFITHESSASMKFITPAPPQAPRPTAPTADDPRMRQIEVLNVASSPALIEAEKTEKVEEYVETTQMGDAPEQTERKSILKKTSSNRRRVVSATKNQGLVAASIRDSLDLVGRKLDKPSKSVKWDKLYYNDSTIAEFGTDNWRPVPIKDTSKKRGRKAQTPKQQEKVEKGAGKRSSKTAKQNEKVEIKPKMTTYTSHAVVVPTPSSGTQLRTETPVIK